MKTRQDAWMEENDLLLAETVLRHVREGSTQLNAFEEVGDKLNRTSAACGFRWNAVVRHQYEKALDLAKKQRKQRQRMLGTDQGGKKKLLYQPPVPSLTEYKSPVLEDAEIESSFEMNVENNESVEVAEEMVPFSGSFIPEFTSSASSSGELNLDHVITYLQQIQHSEFHLDILRSENTRLKRELADLKRERQSLQSKVDKLENNTVTMQEDYETMMKILNRARKFVLFEEEEHSSTTFKMDRNGNLEKLAE